MVSQSMNQAPLNYLATPNMYQRYCPNQSQRNPESLAPASRYPRLNGNVLSTASVPPDIGNQSTSIPHEFRIGKCRAVRGVQRNSFKP